jgi:hypothetical protein
MACLIMTILNVPREYVEHRLALVNKIIQSKLWEKINIKKFGAWGKELHGEPLSRHGVEIWNFTDHS